MIDAWSQSKYLIYLSKSAGLKQLAQSITQIKTAQAIISVELIIGLFEYRLLTTSEGSHD
jgi:hypothetical protein